MGFGGFHIAKFAVNEFVTRVIAVLVEKAIEGQLR
jgi:hypothetical protein